MKTEIRKLLQDVLNHHQTEHPFLDRVRVALRQIDEGEEEMAGPCTSWQDQARKNFDEVLDERDKRIFAEHEVSRLKLELKASVSKYVETDACLIAAKSEAAENFNKYKNACEAVSDLDITHAKAGSQIRRLERDLETYKGIKAKLEEKIKNQRERINYLEGATHHACGTPLTVALENLEAEQAKTAELRGIVEKLREDLKKPVVDEEKMKLRSEMFSIHMLLGAWGFSNFDNAAQRIVEKFDDHEVAWRTDRRDATRWRAVLSSARVRPLGNSGLCQDTLAPKGYAHLGLELTTTCSYPHEVLECENKIGKEWLIKYADIMLEVLEGKHAS